MKEKLIQFINEQKLFLIVLLVNIIIFAVFVSPTVITKQALAVDTYRDIATAQNLLNGNSIFDDPAIKGEFIWYPPLNPAFFALISRITGVDLFKLYAFTPLTIMFFVPLFFFFFIQALFDKKTAFLSVFLIPVMPWLVTYFFTLTIPSLHAFALIIPYLTYFVNSHKKGFSIRNTLILGIWGGILFLHHTPSALIIYGSVFASLFIDFIFLKNKHKTLDLLFILAVPLVMWMPYVLPNLLKPKVNLAPLIYFDDKVKNPEFALYAPNAFTWLFTLAAFISGFIINLKSIKEKKSLLLLYCIIATSIIGQILAYSHALAQWQPRLFGFLKNLPILLPHEFQWFFQLFILPLIACGFIHIFQVHEIKKKVTIVTTVIFALVYLLPPYLSFPYKITMEIEKGVMTKENEPEYTKWIAANTDPNAVFLTSNFFLSYFYIQPYTARKIINQLEAHTSFNIDIFERRRDSDIMLRQADLNSFKLMAEIYDIDYVILEKGNIPEQRELFFRNNFTQVYKDQGEYIIIYKLD